MAARRDAARKALPEVEPQLATSVAGAPSGDAWIFEIKYDGYRALAYVQNGVARLLSRRGLSFDERFEAVVRALPRTIVLPRSGASSGVVLDGEICALDPEGRSKFEMLQNVRGRRGSEQLVYFVFDVLFAGGHDLRGLPLAERKELLEAIVPEVERGPVRRAQFVRGQAEAFAAAARELGLEGLIAKRADRPYRAGRSLDWQKIRFQQRDELAIIGFSPPRGARHRFGALYLGTRDRPGAPLRYAGKVGTGFDTETLEQVHDLLLPRVVDRPPVPDAPRERGAVWVRPELVAEIRFTEWTSEGRLRHPCFLGLRADKGADEIRRERPVVTAAVAEEAKTETKGAPRVAKAARGRRR